MEQQLKQRLIGVTIIVALVVIFVPMLFDSGDKRAKVSGENIPPIPDNIIEKSIDLPKSAEDVAPKDEQKPAETGFHVIPLTDEVPVKKAVGDVPPASGRDAKPMVKQDGEEELAEAEEDMPPENAKKANPGLTVTEKPVVKAVKTEKPPASTKGDVKVVTEPKPESKKPKSAVPGAEVYKEPVRAESAPKVDSTAVKPKTPITPTKLPGSLPKTVDASVKKAEVARPADVPKAVSPKTESAAAQTQSKSAAFRPTTAPGTDAGKSVHPSGKSPDAARTATKATNEKSDVPSAWVIQTGSFTNEDKAKALAEKLRQAKFAAFVESVHGENGSIYRVQVGPELDRGRAEQMQKQIESNVGVKGLILPHR